MVSERGGAWDHYIFGEEYISLVSSQVPHALSLSKFTSYWRWSPCTLRGVLKDDVNVGSVKPLLKT